VRRAGLPGVLGLLLAAGCAAGTGASRPAPPLALSGEGELAAGARRIAARARDAEVIYLGEMHDNPAHHRIQAAVLAAIVDAGARPAVAFEMVPETLQAELDAAVAGEDPPDEVARSLRWERQGWPDFGMYWPLFELARRHRLPAVAADLDPGLARRIGREGLARAGGDAARLQSALPPDPALDRAIARRIQAAHCHLVSEARARTMVEGWHARNVVIARRLVEGLARAPRVVVIIGRGHQTPGGVPDQLRALRPGTRQLVVALGEPGPEAGAEAADDGAPGGIRWLVPAPPRTDPCEGLKQRLG
jgi:uncharacterized iron-regulated protein